MKYANEINVPVKNNFDKNIWNNLTSTTFTRPHAVTFSSCSHTCFNRTNAHEIFLRSVRRQNWLLPIYVAISFYVFSLFLHISLLLGYTGCIWSYFLHFILIYVTYIERIIEVYLNNHTWKIMHASTIWTTSLVRDKNIIINEC